MEAFELMPTGSTRSVRILHSKLVALSADTPVFHGKVRSEGFKVARPIHDHRTVETIPNGPEPS
jgi:hypothetical protein